MSPKPPGRVTGLVLARRGRSVRQTSTTFDEELFEEVRAYAERNQFSFSEAVRTLCSLGLLRTGRGEKT